MTAGEKLKKQFSSRTFQLAMVGAFSKGAEHVVSNPKVWWVAVIVGLVAWIGLGFVAEDATTTKAGDGE